MAVKLEPLVLPGQNKIVPSLVPFSDYSKWERISSKRSSRSLRAGIAANSTGLDRLSPSISAIKAERTKNFAPVAKMRRGIDVIRVLDPKEFMLKVNFLPLVF